MKRYILGLFFLFFISSAYSQGNINNYKYVLVPEKFSFLKENDQYSLNSLTKALLQDKGFTVFIDNTELPTEVANNKCRALNADLLNKSSMFSTSITLVLKDCQGNIVFKSKAGKSREKDYGAGYNMALRDAFTSLDEVSYAYNGSANEMAKPAASTEAATTPAKPATVAATSAVSVAANQPAGTLYAQAIPNGYQLIDTTPKKVLTLLKTSVQNYFIANNDNFSGIVLKINADWFFEYYKDGQLISEKLLVKF